MDTTTPAFSLIIIMLVGLLSLTGIGIYFSFGPPSKKLVDPWEADDDWIAHVACHKQEYGRIFSSQYLSWLSRKLKAMMNG